MVLQRTHFGLEQFQQLLFWEALVVLKELGFLMVSTL